MTETITCPEENEKKHKAMEKSDPETTSAILGPLLNQISIAPGNGTDDDPLRFN